MTPLEAAVWSAVAATISALAALFAMGIQRANRLDTARPELILEGWDRDFEGQVDVITFKSIRNVGKGSALHLLTKPQEPQGPQESGRPLRYAYSASWISILPPGEARDIGGKIFLFWANVPGDAKSLVLDIVVYSWDTLNYRHETRYNIFVDAFTTGQIGVTGDIAPNVVLNQRTTTSRPVWRLRFEDRLRSLFKRRKPPPGPESS